MKKKSSISLWNVKDHSFMLFTGKQMQEYEELYSDTLHLRQKREEEAFALRLKENKPLTAKQIKYWDEQWNNNTVLPKKK
jgi:hypothetical protein